MTRDRRPTEPTEPTEPSAGGLADQPCDVLTQMCLLRCPTMEIEVNDTPETDDDLVRLHSDTERPITACRIHATSQASGARAVLTTPDGRLRFAGESDMTRTVALPDDGSWASFQISGQVRSEAASDAIIEAHCDQVEGPLKAQATVTVCSIAIESETELDYPDDRARTRLGVTERVTLRATDALGAVQWSIIKGHGTLEVEGGACQTYPPDEAAAGGEGEAEAGEGTPPVEGGAPAEGRAEGEADGGAAGEGEGEGSDVEPAPLPMVEGETVTFMAHEIEDETTIQAEDAAGCKVTIEFDVDCNYLIAPARLREIFTTATDARINELTRAFNESYEHFDLTTCLRRAHFFAQVLAEVGTEANPRRENLNYTPAGLIGTFSYFRAHVDEAQLYGRTADHPANQPAIANRAYANRIGNGNIASGDGWAYRGGGYIQVTGRANYQAVQNETNARFPGAGVA